MMIIIREIMPPKWHGNTTKPGVESCEKQACSIIIMPAVTIN